MKAFAPALKYPLRAFLDLSTAHLKQETLVLLNEGVERLHFVIYPTEYGWFVYAHDECFEDLEIPEEMVAAMKKARELGAEYINYDCDADTSPELLPVFPHD